VKNGGFEAGGDLPDAWARHPRKDLGGNRHVRDTRVFRSGRASGQIISVTPQPRGKAPIQWNQYGIKVEGGSTLIVSGYTKTKGVRPYGLGVHFYDAQRAHLGWVSVPGPGKAEHWTHIRREVTVPDEAATMGFVAYAHDKGTTWYDDLAAIATPHTTAIRATPTIDGKLNDACWARDRAITRFVVHTGEKLATAKTHAWLAYDDGHLYAAFRCPHPAGATLRAKATQHDGETWLDDSIEVFVDPHRGRRGYYQLAVNCLGVIRDSRGTASAWQSGARAAVKRDADAWTVELAVPFDPLDIDLDVGTAWGINLVRNDRVNGETVTWSLGGFHNPGRFGKVTLAPNLARFCRAALAKAADRKERDQTRLLSEIRAAGFGDDVVAESLRILDGAKAEIDRLRRIAAGQDALPEGGWQTARRSLNKLTETIATARSAAVSSIFKVGGEADGGFRVAITHALHKVRRSGAVLDGLMTRRVRLDAARDETESFQLVVLPAGAALKGVRVEAPPLVGPGGTVPVTWNRVGYVETSKPCYATAYVGWWPDPLFPPGPFDVAADHRQPVWFNAAVPPDAKPGTYTGKVTIRHAARAVSVPVELRVRSFRLPRPGTLATAFGLYAFALSKGYYGNAPYRDKMSIEDYARWCEFFGRRRLTPKNIGREYITKTPAGRGFKVDMSGTKKLVAPLADKYFAPYSFCAFRLPTGPQIGKPGSASDPNIAADVVKWHVDEWQRQGLPSKVYIYGYDEPRRDHYEFLCQAYAKVRQVAPDYPIMQTIGDRNPRELVGSVDIWCPLTPALSHAFYTNRAKTGDTLWTYVCCSPKPPYANFFIDEPSVDHRVLFWQARQHGATGVLYWCMCWWDGLPTPGSDKGRKHFPDVPIRSKDHGTYKRFKTNGDGLLVYPGPNLTPWSSVRLEVIRDGIEDYEYLALLSRLVARAKALPAGKRPPATLIRQADALCTVPKTISKTLTDYTKQPEVILAQRRRLADALERLTRALGANAE